ncbi:MAG: CvpA family protein [Planctomycetota bacterium]
MFLALVQEDPSPALQTVDTVGLAIVGLFALLGLWRGLWWQLLRLAGLAGAVAVARSLEPTITPLLEGHTGDMDPRVPQGFVWLGLFLVSLAVVAVIGRLGKRLLEAVQLGLVDRVGGAVAGALTGLVIHAAAMAVLVQVADDEFLASNFQGTVSARLVEVAGIDAPLLFGGDRAEGVRQRLVPVQGG